MEDYHFRLYTIMLALDIFVDACARLRDDCGKDILTVSFFFIGGQLLVAKRHIDCFYFI